MRVALVLASVVVLGQTASTDLYVPSKLVEGSSPSAPGERTPDGAVAGGMIAGGGEVQLELTVGTNGRVSDIGRIRVTPPYTDLVSNAVETWRFMPAEVASARERRHAIESRVLVAAIYRPRALYTGHTLGEVPRDVGRPSSLIPVPHEMIAPPYPPTARATGTVLLEVEIGADGSPRAVRVVHSGGGFDSASIQALEHWSFTPARSDRGPVPSFAYVVMGFLEPIVPGRGR